jgi:hypothetical protein
MSFFPSKFAYFSSINLVSICRCSSSKTNPVYSRLLNSLVLVCSLSSHRHSYIKNKIHGAVVEKKKNGKTLH